MRISGAGFESGRSYCILGTAGHIDHGKSSLVKALTGTDPDRLPEEQARGMTIELGFAHLTLGENGSHRHVGIVDAPGHERFVRTMVAGATGIDIAMLVVAADDGVMPQTREHVDILDLLGVSVGVVALSKIDIVPAERVQAVKDQIKSLTSATSLGAWPILPCSAVSGAGLGDMRSAINGLMERLPPIGCGPIFRLAIDRVFGVHGRGTVVTGSVLAGNIEAGAVLELMPGGQTCKVREVQSHHSQVSGAGIGQRAALNLTGIERDQIDRGMELATPGYLEPTRYADARVRILSRVSRPMQSHSRVRVCMGTRETLASLVIVDSEDLAPGGESLVQLRFHEPVVCAFGQRFIIRNETAQATIGGGSIVRPVSRRLRTRDADERESLNRAADTDLPIRFDEAVRAAEFNGSSDLRMSSRVGCEPVAVPVLRDQLRKTSMLVQLSPGVEVHGRALAALERRTGAFLKRYHQMNPNEPGIMRDRLVTWLEARSSRAAGKAILQRMEASGRVLAKGPYVADCEFRPAMSPDDASLFQRIIDEVTRSRWDPPEWSGLKSTSGLSKQRSQTLEDSIKADGRLIMIAPRHYMSSVALDEFKSIVQRLGSGRPFKLAEVRDATQLSRRAVQPILEHLDRVGFTKRVGDERVLVEPRR